MNCRSFYPMPACSYHGTCDMNDGLCKCDDGWTSIGDLSTEYGSLCSIHIMTIRVLWILAVLPFPFLIYFSSKVLYNRISSTTKMDGDNGGGNRKWYMLLIDPSFIFPCTFFLCSTFGGILPILKIINPVKYSVGNDLLTTFVYSFCCATAMSGICVYLFLLVNFILGYAKMMPSESREKVVKQSKAVKLISNIAMVLGIASSYVPFANYVHPSYDVICVRAFSVAFALLALILGLMLLSYLTMMSREIGAVVENASDKSSPVQSEKKYDQLRAVKVKLDRAWKAVLLCTFSTAVTYSIILSWDFFCKNLSYIVPMLTVSLNVMFIIFTRSIVKEASDSDSSKTQTQIQEQQLQQQQQQASTGNSGGRAVVPIVNATQDIDISKPIVQTTDDNTTGKYKVGSDNDEA